MFDKEETEIDIRSALKHNLTRYFGYESFRPHQEPVCFDLVKGRDVLLVMPTGAGKSLCYQIPGLTRNGPTLVVSPLIALMDDQVESLRSVGIAADAIHTGKSREQSREICRQYMRSELAFLFVAPERLEVPGFCEFLAAHKPVLIAIDEAHCISQWGHDFRFAYRRLKMRIEALRPAPVIAMTATATLNVQQDIIDQLGLKKVAKHIHGFRRKNIAIESVEASKSDRIEIASHYLKSSAGSLPAIIYAPTRAGAEKAAEGLSAQFRVAAYHAGMENDRRAEIQTAFLSNDLDIIVATVAFGMGIDKSNVRSVIHLALPSSIEGYYQEIGRAGRDGNPSRAVVISSYADVKTHEFFQNRNYPEVEQLRQVLTLIPPGGIQLESIVTSLEVTDLHNHIDRLVMSDALTVGPDGLIFRTGNAHWQAGYIEQKRHRAQQLSEMIRYVKQSSRCRMLRLMAHFGDPDANGAPCGLCDICLPQDCVIKHSRSWRSDEVVQGKALLEAVVAYGRPMALGRVFREVAKSQGLSWGEFHSRIQSLKRAGIVDLISQSFTRGGELVSYEALQVMKTIKRIDWTVPELIDAKLAKPKINRKKRGSIHGAARAKRF